MRVLIAGAGPGGLALAKALTTKGATCTVFERLPGIVQSSCFALGLNGALVARAIGLEDHLNARMHPIRFSAIKRHDGRLLAKSGDTYESLKDRYGLKFGLLRRGDFCAAALEALPEGTVRFDSQVVQTENIGDGVRATLQDGTAYEGDVFVACDGVNSSTRAAHFDEPKFSWSGFKLFYGLTDKSAVDPSLLPEPGVLNLLYGASGNHYAVQMAMDTEVYWAMYERSREPPRDWASQYQHQDREELVAKIAHWNNATLKALISNAKTMVRTEHFLPPRSYLSDAWHQGRIGLLGDAAHKVMPFTGQGLNMALDDALVLARCLSSLSPVDAFEEYHRVRYQRTVATRDKALAMGGMQLPESNLKRYLRDASLRILGLTGLFHRVSVGAAADIIFEVDQTLEEVAKFEAAPTV